MPERDTIPTLPRKCMLPGMMPILHSSGVITPGQLGPINRAPLAFKAAFTFSISNTGIPSVMHIIKSIPASQASKIESAANAGGT